MSKLQLRSLLTPASIAGFLLLTAWGLWWIGTFLESPPRLLFAEHSWLPAWQFIGFDLMHNHLAVLGWLNGLNPYLERFGDPRGLYTYPPVVPFLFAWVALTVDPLLTSAVWAAVIATACIFALWEVGQFRQREGLSALSLPLFAGLLLWSAPVVFAMERGNCDALVLVFTVMAALALQRTPNWRLELFAALCLSLAIAVKIYPLVIFAALIALRRYRVLLLTCLGLILLVAVAPESWAQWLNVLRSSPGSQIDVISQVISWAKGEGVALVPSAGQYERTALYWGSLHTPGNWWPALWLRAGAESIAAWPLPVVQFVTLAPPTLWGCWKVFRAPAASRLALPILLWITSIAVFAMPTSWDYNLFFLPLLLIALWDKKHPQWMHALSLTVLLWWIPFGPVGYDWALARDLSKLLALYLGTALLIRALPAGSAKRGAVLG